MWFRPSQAEGSEIDMAPPCPSRVDRQVILPEVGTDGQLRLERGELVLSADLSERTVEVARKYAQGAGLRSEVISRPDALSKETSHRAKPAQPNSLPRHLLSVFRHDPSHEVAHGALVALSSIKRLLGLP